jgi:hypothetical protein
MTPRRCEAWSASTDAQCKHKGQIERISQGGIRLDVCFNHYGCWRLYPHWWTRAERRAP